MKSCFPTAPQRYEGTKFKMTELGPIPSDWEVKRLGEMLENENARLQTGPFGTVLSVSEFVESGHPVISVREIRTGYIQLFDETPCVSDETYKRLSKYTLNPNDLVFARKGSVDRSALIPDDGISYFLGSDGIVVRFNNDGFCPRYILYYLQSETAKKYLVNQAYGTTMAGLNEGIMRSLLLPLPPLSEQRRIAAALSDVDELIGALGKLVEKKRAIKTGAMQRLLTGQTRLPGFGGEWEEKRLGEIGTSVRGVSFKPEQSSFAPLPNTTMLLRANNIQDSRIVLEDIMYVQNECMADCQRLKDGDILICAANGSRNLVGKAAIWKRPSLATFGAFMAVFRCAESVNSAFIGYFFQSASYRRQLDDILTGSAINNLNARDIEGLYFSLPPSPEQRAIAAVLSDMDAEIAALEAEKRKVEAIKQGMMQKLLTGRTRLG